MRTVKNLFLLLSVGLLSFSVQAGPGIHVTNISTSPQDAPTVAAWMDGAGKGAGNRMLIQRHVADGADPATHSIVSIYPSMAESEVFSNKVGADKELMAQWQAFLGKVVPVA